VNAGASTQCRAQPCWYWTTKGLKVILHGIRGLGGTVMKTNVDLERAKLIQATLKAEPATVNPIPNGDPK